MIDVDNVSVRYMMGDFKDIGLKEYLIRKVKGQMATKEFLGFAGCQLSCGKGNAARYHRL